MSDDALIELEQLLRDEREAIRRLDGAKVLAFAERKEALMHVIRKALPLTADQGARLRALTPLLRHNSVLLAHARDILRDALKTAAQLEVSSGAKEQPRAAAAPPRLLSVRG
ncbi:MAG TPA: hypothetical protein VGM06_14405 [Polyangiaceae bacterium]|jgi:hypothetical protein